MGDSTTVRVKLPKEYISYRNIPNRYALQNSIDISDKDLPNLRIDMAAALPIALYDLHSGIYIPPVGPARVVATVRQKTISRLKRLFPQLFALSNPGPPNLSLEIILMIAEYFDKCTLVSLAFTC